MDNSGYVGLTKQMGLRRELNTIANNIANMSTNGFRREGAVFAEHVAALQNGEPSLSMSTLSRRYVDMSAGELTITKAPLDVAIDGDGFFLVETPAGERLTRDGAFTLNSERELINSQNYRVLDESGGAITIPQGTENIIISEDGSVFADGQPRQSLALLSRIRRPSYAKAQICLKRRAATRLRRTRRCVRAPLKDLTLTQLKKWRGLSKYSAPISPVKISRMTKTNASHEQFVRLGSRNRLSP